MVDTQAQAVIRGYRPSDHLACRSLWAELVEVHRELYADPKYGGHDPGAAFEDYLTRLDLTGMWVADDSEAGVVGLIGLLLDGRGGAVEPVIVATAHRGGGIGKALLGRVASEAKKRRMTHLSVAPETRDLPALAALTSAGYTTLSRLTLTLPLAEPHEEPDERPSLDFLGHTLRY
ncbi:GNAT family N-acetyltransferase [Phytomonospora sp. NPDC050363]|uniref:GNAT family N-acetyltransferase n=1 Tax=Phytomonospora sp. NPDC050363 TaxID=3155642 RepID=UPI0033D2796F